MGFPSNSCLTIAPKFDRGGHDTRVMTDQNLPGQDGGWTVVVETTFEGCFDPYEEGEEVTLHAEGDDTWRSTRFSDLSPDEDVDDPEPAEKSVFSFKTR
jgi:hypothetical protein